MDAALCPFVVGGDCWILEVDVDEEDIDCRGGFLKVGIGRALNCAVCLGRGRARNWCVTGVFAGGVARVEVRSSNGFSMVALRGLATTGWDDSGGGCGGWM